ncbi:lipoprotein [Ramlibacter sp.]|uniref:LPS translocon maturation chaperone LptM n=1 Tax=Ramlibacter sp. TaxID=1917967 RepID=UPI0035AE8A67
MLRSAQILDTPLLVRRRMAVATLALAGLLAGCGQKGPLYMPAAGPASAPRPTLGQLLFPVSGPAAAASAPARPASAPTPSRQP